MKRGGTEYAEAFRHALLAAGVALVCVSLVQAQESAYERTFPQPKATVEKVLRQMRNATAGRLPVLAGFAAPADHPLEQYQRGYYQAKFEVSASPSGGSIVRVSVQVTAWYADPDAGRSGYQLLPSNGRLEADMLDQLADQLAIEVAGRGGSSATPAPGRTGPVGTLSGRTSAGRPASARTSSADESTPSAPMPRLPEVGSGISSSLARSLEEQQKAGGQSGAKKPGDQDKDKGGPLQTEAESLEEILKNQAHPKNLVAVKKSGTPVVGSASLNAKTLFLASAHDEFEMLDFNRDWVHVRISGLSRGWIWRNNLEMPDSVPDGDAPTGPAPRPVAAELFHVSREETALFPGDWEPLRGKSVRILSVENTSETEKDPSPRLRLEFAKSVLDKSYTDLAQKAQDLAGIVLIFDAADGGMIAATFSIVQQWKAGKLSDAALWHQCFFDPPETFAESGSAGNQ